MWPAALLCGASFALSQFVVSNFIGPYLTDIISALVSAITLLVLMRFWKPANVSRFESQSATSPDNEPAKWTSSVQAWTPYILLIVLVIVWGTGWTARWLDRVTLRVNVPFLHNTVLRTPPVTATNSQYAAVYVFNWLGTPGTATFLAAFFAALISGVSLGRFARLMVQTLRRLIVPALTISAVLALIAIFVGLYLPAAVNSLNEWIGTGFMLGGVFALFFGTATSYTHLGRFVKPIVLILELALVIFMAYKQVGKFRKDKKK